MNRLLRKMLCFAMALLFVLCGFDATGLLVAQVRAFDTSLSAQDVVRRLGAGWNLGDTYDAYDSSMDGDIDPTQWGNPVATQTLFNSIKAMGFDSVRIPVSWSSYLTAESRGYGSSQTSTTPVIQTDFLNQVRSVVAMAINADLYVVLNIHHPHELYGENASWSDPTTENLARAEQYATSLWYQIASCMQAFDEHLVFEVLNEPRDRANDDWYGNETLWANQNALNAACLNAIRATGGNNAERLVLLPTYAHSKAAAGCAALSVPTSLPCGVPVGRVAAAVHIYEPGTLCFETGNETAWTAAGKSAVDATFASLKTSLTDRGLPFVITEWGTSNKSNLVDRINHAAYFTQACKEAGGALQWWDNGAILNREWKSEYFGILNRSTPEVAVFPMLLSALQYNKAESVTTAIYVDGVYGSLAGVSASGETLTTAEDRSDGAQAAGGISQRGTTVLSMNVTYNSSPRVLLSEPADFSGGKNNGKLCFSYKMSAGNSNVSVRLFDALGNGEMGISQVPVQLTADGFWHTCELPLTSFGSLQELTTWGNPNNNAALNFGQIAAVGFQLSGTLAVDELRVTWNSAQSSAVTIATQPQDAETPTNTAVELGVVTLPFADAAEITYQWYQCDNAAGENAVALTGKTSEELSVIAAETGTYYYFCVCSAAGKSAATSRVAAVRVVPFTDSLYFWKDAYLTVPISYGQKVTTAADADGNNYLLCDANAFCRVFPAAYTGGTRYNLSDAASHSGQLSVRLRLAQGAAATDIYFCVAPEAYFNDWSTYYKVKAGTLSSADWVEFTVDLSDFSAITDWSSVGLVGLFYSGTTKTVHADDIRVTWDSRTVDPPPVSGEYDVDIRWGAMTYSYVVSDQTWDDANHCWRTGSGQGAWRADGGSAVTVTNHSDTGITADFRFTPADGYLLSGAFQCGGSSLTSTLSIASEQEKEVSFMPSGSLPDATENYTAVGTITVELHATAAPVPDKLIALTFDDGPSPVMEMEMNLLKQYNAKATFFVIGDAIDGYGYAAASRTYEALVQRAVAEGHEIGNHSKTTASMTTLTDAQITEYIAYVQQRVYNLTGTTPKYFRPPNLAYVDSDTDLRELIDMPFIICSIDTSDWSKPGADAIIAKIKQQAADGGIIIMHCFNDSALLEQNRAVLQEILPWLQAQGYQMVTVSELFAAKGVTAQDGVLYSTPTRLWR